MFIFAASIVDEKMNTLHRHAACGVAVLLILSACAAHRVETTRAALVGQPWRAIEGCMGVPTRHDGDVAEWDYAEPPASASLPLSTLALLPLLPVTALAGSISVGDSGTCRVIATLHAGVIERLVLSGANTGLSGRGAVCEPVMRGCE
jgi:hypothetical protein